MQSLECSWAIGMPEVFDVMTLGDWTDMTRRWSRYRLGPRQVGWLRQAGLAAVCLGAVSGCSATESGWQAWQSSDWYGYYYENVMVNAAPAVSKPFATAQQCLAAMRAYTQNSSRWTGFACARGCLPHKKNGALTDCIEVVH